MDKKNKSFNIFLALVVIVSIVTIVLTFTTTEAEKVLEKPNTDSVQQAH